MKTNNHANNQPLGLRTFYRRANDGVWRLRRTRKRNVGVCAVAYCQREQRADKRSRLCHTCESREWRANHPVHAAYHRLKSHARQRRILFDLTLDQFKRFLSEMGKGYMEQKGNNRPEQLQIDRIDNRKGYTDGNIQVLTLQDNVHKRWYEDASRYPF